MSTLWTPPAEDKVLETPSQNEIPTWEPPATDIVQEDWMPPRKDDKDDPINIKDPLKISQLKKSGQQISDEQERILFDYEDEKPITQKAGEFVGAALPEIPGAFADIAIGGAELGYKGLVLPLNEMFLGFAMYTPEQRAKIIRDRDLTYKALASGGAQGLDEAMEAGTRLAILGSSITDKAQGLPKEERFRRYMARESMRKLSQAAREETPDTLARLASESPLIRKFVSTVAAMEGGTPEAQEAAVKEYEKLVKESGMTKEELDEFAKVANFGDVKMPTSIPGANTLTQAISKPIVKATQKGGEFALRGLNLGSRATGWTAEKTIGAGEFIQKKARDIGEYAVNDQDTFVKTAANTALAPVMLVAKPTKSVANVITDITRQVDVGGAAGRRGMFERAGRDVRSSELTQKLFGPEGRGGVGRAKLADWAVRQSNAMIQPGVNAGALNVLMGLSDAETAAQAGQQFGTGFGIGAYSGSRIESRAFGMVDPRTTMAQKVSNLVTPDPTQLRRDQDADIKRFMASASPEMKQQMQDLASIDKRKAAIDERIASLTDKQSRTINKEDSEFLQMQIDGFQKQKAALEKATPETQKEYDRLIQLTTLDALDQAQSVGIAAGLRGMNLVFLDPANAESFYRNLYGQTLIDAERNKAVLEGKSVLSPDEQNTMREANETLAAFAQKVNNAQNTRGFAISEPVTDANDPNYIPPHLRMQNQKGATAVISMDLVKHLTSQGFNVRHAIQHEVQHALEDFKEVQDLLSPVRKYLFDQKIQNDDGTFIVVSEGVYNDQKLDEYAMRYAQKFSPADGGAGFFAQFGGDIQKQRDYIKREILAEVATSSGDYEGGSRAALDDVGRNFVDWLEVTTKNGFLKKMKEGLRKVGVIVDNSGGYTTLFEEKISPEVLATIRQYQRGVRDLNGALTYNASREIEEPDIPLVKILENRALQEKYKNADFFEKEQIVKTTQPNGSQTEIVIPEGANLDSFTGIYRIQNGQLVDEDGTPMQLAPEIDIQAMPEGTQFEVDTRIARHPDDSPIIIQNREMKRRAIDRTKMLVNAIESAPKDDSPFRMIDVGNGDYRGAMSPSQVEALMQIPNTILSPNLKRMIQFMNEILRRGDGTRVMMEYQAALLNGKYKSIAPRIRDEVPIGFKITKDGNFTVTTMSVSRMYDKMNAWAAKKPLNLSLWGGDTGKFWDSVLKVLDNHARGERGEVGLHPDPYISLRMKYKVNDLFNVYNAETKAANPDRTTLPREKGKDPIDVIVRSRRLDRINSYTENSAQKLPMNYGKLLENYLPENNPLARPQTPEEMMQNLDGSVTATRIRNAIASGNVEQLESELRASDDLLPFESLYVSQGETGEPQIQVISMLEPGIEPSLEPSEIPRDIDAETEAEIARLDAEQDMAEKAQKDQLDQKDQLEAQKAQQDQQVPQIRAEFIPPAADELSQAALDERKAKLPKYKTIINDEEGEGPYLAIYGDDGEEIGRAIYSIIRGNDDENIMFVDYTEVGEKYQNKGYGEALYRELAKLAQKEGVTRIEGVANKKAIKVRSKLFRQKPDPLGLDMHRIDLVDSGISYLPAEDVLNSLKNKLPKYKIKMEEQDMNADYPAYGKRIVANINIALPSGKRIGYAHLEVGAENEPNAVEVLQLEVDPKYRGLGYGEALYREIAKYAISQNKKFIYSPNVSSDAARVRRKLFEESPRRVEGKWKKQGWPMRSKVDSGISYLPAEDPFYSRLQRGIQESQQATYSPDQAKALARKSTNAEELKWSGIENAIDSIAEENNGKVPKQALLDYMANEGQVKFKETNLAELNRSEEIAKKYGITLEITPEEVVAWDKDDESLEWDEFPEELKQELLRTQNMEASKYAKYQLPGGENYREIVLTMPEKEIGTKQYTYDDIILTKGKSNWRFKTKDGIVSGLIPGGLHPEEIARDYALQIAQTSESSLKKPSGEKSTYTSSHFANIPNYVAHIRLNERKDAEGKEGLFIEEIQSDRHQQGRKYGYDSDIPKFDPAKLKVEKAPAGGYTAFNVYYDGVLVAQPPSFAAKNENDAARIGRESVERGLTLNRQGKTPIPDAPFRKDWPLQMFKRALRDAVASGKEWIGWTTGDTQAERYDLSKQVDEVSYGGGFLRVKTKAERGGTRNYINEEIPPERIEDYIGKETARRLLESPKEEIGKQGSEIIYRQTIRGNDLKIGGEGMKGFYDQILPKEIGRYVNKMGGKVEKSTISEGQIYNDPVFDIPQEAQDEISQIAHNRVRRNNPRLDDESDDYREKVDEIIQELSNQWVEKNGEKRQDYDYWKVNITPEMAAIVSKGQPQYLPAEYSDEYGLERGQEAETRLTPRTLYNLYYIATEPEPTSEYGREISNEYIDKYKRLYVDVFSNLVRQQIEKYIGRGRVDSNVTKKALDKADTPEMLDELMRGTYRSDMRRRNDVWNIVTDHLKNLASAKTKKDKIFYMDRLNNSIHNTQELLFSKFSNYRQLQEAFDSIHNARDTRAYAQRVDKDLRESNSFNSDTAYLPYVEYELPKDPRKIMADFYLLTSVGDKAGYFGKDWEKIKDGQMPTRTGLRYEEYGENLEEAVGKLAEQLKRHMTDSLLFSVTAELRHAFDEKQPSDLIDNEFMNSYRDILNTYKKLDELRGNKFFEEKSKELLPESQRTRISKGSKKEYQLSNMAIRKAMEETNTNIEQLSYIAENLFRKGNWAYKYGGEPWGDISEGLRRIHGAESLEEIISAIDNAYDLQHNTNTVFDKIRKYSRQGGYQWLQDMLDFKYHAMTPRELVPLASSAAKRIAAPALLDIGDPAMDKSRENAVSASSEELVSGVESAIGRLKGNQESVYNDIWVKAQKGSGKDINEELFKWLRAQMPARKDELEAVGVNQDLIRYARLLLAEKMAPEIEVPSDIKEMVARSIKEQKQRENPALTFLSIEDKNALMSIALKNTPDSDPQYQKVMRGIYEKYTSKQVESIFEWYLKYKYQVGGLLAKPLENIPASYTSKSEKIDFGIPPQQTLNLKPFDSMNWEAFSGASEFERGKNDEEKQPLIGEIEMLVNGQPMDLLLIADANGFQISFGEENNEINVPAELSSQKYAKQHLEEIFNSGELHEFLTEYSDSGDVFTPVVAQKQPEAKQEEKTPDIEEFWPKALSFMSLSEIEYIKQTIKDSLEAGKNYNDWIDGLEIYGQKAKILYSPDSQKELKNLFDTAAKKFHKSLNPRLSINKAEDYFQNAINNSANYGWKEIVDINADWPEQLVDALFQYGQTKSGETEFLSLPQTISIGERTYTAYTPNKNGDIFILYGDYNNSGEDMNYNWTGAAQFKTVNKTAEEIISDLSEWLKGEVDNQDPQI